MMPNHFTLHVWEYDVTQRNVNRNTAIGMSFSWDLKPPMGYKEPEEDEHPDAHHR